MRTAPQEYVLILTQIKSAGTTCAGCNPKCLKRAGSSLHIELDPAVHIGAAGKVGLKRPTIPAWNRLDQVIIRTASRALATSPGLSSAERITIGTELNLRTSVHTCQHPCRHHSQGRPHQECSRMSLIRLHYCWRSTVRAMRFNSRANNSVMAGHHQLKELEGS